MKDLARETAAVIRALRERDENTSAHCGRTCGLAVETAQACALSASDLETLKLAAELHDAGKIGIPGRLLLKPLVRAAWPQRQPALNPTHDPS